MASFLDKSTCQVAIFLIKSLDNLSKWLDQVVKWLAQVTWSSYKIIWANVFGGVNVWKSLERLVKWLDQVVKWLDQVTWSSFLSWRHKQVTWSSNLHKYSGLIFCQENLSSRLVKSLEQVCEITWASYLTSRLVKKTCQVWEGL